MSCSSCRYWTRHGQSLQGECGMIDMMTPKEKVKDKGAVIDADATDDSGLSAKLVTNENFGCTMYEEK